MTVYLTTWPSFFDFYEPARSGSVSLVALAVVLPEDVALAAPTLASAARLPELVNLLTFFKDNNLTDQLLNESSYQNLFLISYKIFCGFSKLFIRVIFG